jgi:hypothetical protein
MNWPKGIFNPDETIENEEHRDASNMPHMNQHDPRHSIAPYLLEIVSRLRSSLNLNRDKLAGNGLFGCRAISQQIDTYIRSGVRNFNATAHKFGSNEHFTGFAYQRWIDCHKTTYLIPE